jgi:hypothetical protein
VTGTLRALRKLVLGETWAVPAGVAASLGVVLAVRPVLPHDLWSSAGGFVLASGVVATLSLSLRLRR